MSNTSNVEAQYPELLAAVSRDDLVVMAMVNEKMNQACANNIAKLNEAKINDKMIAWIMGVSDNCAGQQYRLYINAQREDCNVADMIEEYLQAIYRFSGLVATTHVELNDNPDIAAVYVHVITLTGKLYAD